MSRAIILLGGGGHGAVIADALLNNGRQLIGVVDPSLPRGSEWRFGLSVLGGDEFITQYASDQVELANGIGYVPETRSEALRSSLFNKWRAKGYQFASIIHPRAWVGIDVTLGAGVQVLANSVINTGARIGDNCIINTGVIIEHDTDIQADTHVAPGAVICGNCVVENNSFIGAGATVIHGQRVLRNSVVPAGSCYRGNKNEDK
ncbi:sugar acetyltransferase [Pseudomaricurvus alcaniphilus]|uniref:NeuD/PglB/VioB family sugar acetyltransferase n=1 Tax=Pseudomaricurvus alcaniphilus TaxID=1166482 RepID=UPI00140915CC|nr:NeuD/PglB/VioB family sugar acetyltransferase [Pseudomaricurvus alcaniphilus]NHN39440.1 sugar acetyltransferase [Pseudomaricurvus alcaniphilus]